VINDGQEELERIRKEKFDLILLDLSIPEFSGWDVGKLSSSDFDSTRMSTFTYRVRTPQYSFMVPKIKVALAWDSIAVLSPGVSFLAIDLDLLVFDDSNNQVADSSSFDNSYEIAEFNAERGKAQLCYQLEKQHYLAVFQPCQKTLFQTP
jgi:hypothetical protein